jgi:hypothetical protein
MRGKVTQVATKNPPCISHIILYQTTNSDGSLFYITGKRYQLALTTKARWANFTGISRHQRSTLERNWLELVCACFLVVDLLEVIQAVCMRHVITTSFPPCQLVYVQHMFFRLL